MTAYSIDPRAQPGVQPDIAVRAASGELIATVEIKAASHLPPEIARELRGNWAQRDLLSKHAYFVMVSQDHGYLWEPDVQPWLDAAPTLVFPMGPVVARYLRPEDTQRTLWEGELLLIVSDWLDNLTVGIGDAASEPERSLGTVGFLDAMRRAKSVDIAA